MMIGQKIVGQLLKCYHSSPYLRGPFKKAVQTAGTLFTGIAINNNYKPGTGNPGSQKKK